MRILAFPFQGIAYTTSFYEAIENRGIDVVEGRWEGHWILENVNKEDVIHIHWPSFLYQTQGSITNIIRGFLRFSVLLIICKLRSSQIWWTAHNLYPHQRSRFPFIDSLARRFLIFLCRGILVHGNEAKKLIIQEFRSAAKKCITIPHGHWIGRYPPGPSRELSRDSLGIGPEVEFVYLLFGQCQPYKNIITLIRAFKKTATSDDRLIIAGRFSTEKYYNDSLLESENDPRIIIHNRFIPDEVVSVYFNASDIMCIPYSEILTSGSGMLALSYGLPVLSIKKGYLEEFIPDYCGILMKNTNFEDICSALTSCKSRKWDADKIKHYAKQFEFDDAASIYLEALSR